MFFVYDLTNKNEIIFRFNIEKFNQKVKFQKIFKNSYFTIFQIFFSILKSEIINLFIFPNFTS